MYKYLTTAAVFPGLWLACQLNSTNQTVYAKSSSHSSSSHSSKPSSSHSPSSSSHSSSSSSHSSPSSSHSSPSSSHSSSSSSHSSSATHSLTKQRSQHSSSLNKHVRSDGNRRFLNRRSYVKNRQENKQMTFVGLLSLLGVVSRYFYRYERIRYCLPIIRRALKKAMPINLNTLSKEFDGQLVYGSSSLSVESKGLLCDRLFGVRASVPDSLALLRKVEVFKQGEKENEKGQWRNSSYVEAFHTDLFHRSMTESIILPYRVLIGEYELNNSQLKSIGEQKTVQISFDPDMVDEVFQELKDANAYSENKPSRRFGRSFNKPPPTEKDSSVGITDDTQEESSQEEPDKQKGEAECLRYTETAEPTKTDLFMDYNRHPFTYAIGHGKEIMYENDYIYISSDINNPSEGDMRISFHELKPILNATLIAQQKGISFTEYLIPELAKLKLNLRLFSQGKESDAKFNVINIIKGGVIEKEQLIKEYVKNTKSNIRLVSITLAWIIYLIYAAIFDEIGASLNPFNYFGKNAQQRKLKSKQNAIQTKGKGTVISKNNNLSPLSLLLAVPFAGVHIGAISLFALARSYAAVMAGGAVGAYFVFSLYNDYKQDKEQLSSIGEKEEEELHDDEDASEHQILSLLQNSEVKE